ncbi:hypothetical protein HDU91_001948, partial [Kappamyces sp. JEL0680]
MVLDLKLVKQWMKDVVEERLDHRCLEELDYFKTRPSSAENLAIYIWNETRPLVELALEDDRNRWDFVPCDKPRFWLHCVDVQETDSIVVSYRG